MRPDETERNLRNECPTGTDPNTQVQMVPKQVGHEALRLSGAWSSCDISPWLLTHPELLGLVQYHGDGPLPRVSEKTKTNQTKLGNYCSRLTLPPVNVCTILSTKKQFWWCKPVCTSTFLPIRSQIAHLWIASLPWSDLRKGLAVLGSNIPSCPSEWEVRLTFITLTFLEKV